MTASIQEIVCCLGQPVAGNPTQYMMEKAFAAAGLDWRYLTLEVPPEALADAMRGLRALGLRGANFTIPHKVAVLEYLDELSPAAERMGAVNCVHRVGDKLVGENTDGKGFLQSLREFGDPSGKRVAIVGAGGAARAIAVELALAGISHLTVVNRSEDRGRALAALLREKTSAEADFVRLEAEYAVPANADILINATSVGHSDAQARVPVAVDSLRPELIVADVIFNPPRTWLIRTAAERGCRTLDGLGMLVNQAVISFKIWTGVEPDAGVMREALEEFLEL
jgi:shikimate dehydrogenase